VEKDKRLKWIKVGIVASLVLGIILFSILSNVCAMISNITCCPSDPINVVVMGAQKAMSGVPTTTKTICMEKDDTFSSDMVVNRITTVESFEFKLRDEKHQDILKTAPNSIEALQGLSYRMKITCDKMNSDKYACVGEIVFDEGRGSTMFRLDSCTMTLLAIFFSPTIILILVYLWVIRRS
jgi:hypothetical protein